MNVDISLINKNDKIAVALSGGEDSVFLLHNLLMLSEKYSFKVLAVNVEHGIRGEESKKDSVFVANLCKTLGVTLYTYSVNAKEYARERKLSLEQAARKLRYDCFYDLINSKRCDKIATAHHLKDNAESVLFNLFRGSGQKGLGGILPEFEGKIIRPILSISKDEITKYIKENKLSFVTDSTNYCTDFTRNFIRLELLPKIIEKFPRTEQNVLKFSEIAREDDDFISSFAEKSLIFDGEVIKVPIGLHPAVLKRATIIAMKKLGVKKDWEKAHLDAVLSLAKGETGKSADLKLGIVAVKEYDTVCFYKRTKRENVEVPFRLGEIEINGIKVSIEKRNPKDLTLALYGDNDKIPKGAVIRFFKNGDKFTKFGGGTKSLSDFFTDKKVPTRLRRKLPVLAVGSDVLCVFSLAVSDKIRVDKTTESIIQFKYENLGAKDE